MVNGRRWRGSMMPGLFAGALPNGSTRYQLRAQFGDKLVELDDPYRFPPVLSDFDLYLLGEGTHQRIYDKLGAHPMTLEGVEGVAFVVLAPNARGVSVVGDFNYWNPRRHPMRVRGVGYWELFIPHARVGDHYKFDIIEPNGQHLPLKSDPVAFAAEVRPKTASIVFDEANLPRPRPAPAGMNALSAPMSIYEVHLGSWRRKGSNEWLTYRELAEQLPAYVRDLGFTHVEFLPDQRTSVRRLLGLSADRHVSRRPAGSARRRILQRWSMPSIARASPCCSTGCPGTFPTIPMASAISTAPHCTSTPIPCRAAISTGAR